MLQREAQRWTRLAPRALLGTAVAALALLLSGCEFWQYNIANGGTPPKTRGQEDIKSKISGGARPVAMTLEEVCGHRFNELLSFLRNYGYSGTFHNVNTAGCSGNGYGNAIFHLGSRVAFAGHPSGVLRLIYTTNNRPHRVGAMAVAIGAGSNRAIVWVTHLEAADDSAASAQAWELLQSVHYWRDVTGWLPVVGGDFNLTPNQFPMRDWCAQFREALSCSSSAPTHAAGKIDYLFSPTWRWGRTYISANSDHRRLAAGITGAGPSG